MTTCIFRLVALSVLFVPTLFLKINATWSAYLATGQDVSRNELVEDVSNSKNEKTLH